jgi:hypothetical protein
MVVEDAAPEHKVVITCDGIDRIYLHPFYGAYSVVRAFFTPHPASRPQPLPAQQIAPGGPVRDAERGVTHGQYFSTNGLVVKVVSDEW